jgi:FSR family fosmidomycin resistance protein-like MFS transporter
MNVTTAAKRVSPAVFLIALAHMSLELSHNFLPVTYPLFIQTMGLSYAQVGSLALSAGIFGALVQPLFGYLSDRWDPRLIIALSIGWSGLLMGLVGFVGEYWLLMPIVGLGALGSAAFHPAGASLAATGVPQRQGVAMSVFSVGGNLGSALSPLLVGLGLAWFGLPGTALLMPVGLMIAFCLYQQVRAFPLAVGPRPAAVSVRSAEPGNRAEHGSWLLLSMVILIVAARSWFQGSLMTYLPEWLQSNGLSLAAAGSMLSVLLVAVSVGSLSGGTLSDRVGRVPVVAISLGLLGPAHWLFLHSAGMPQILCLMFIGALIGATFPVAILMAQETWPHAVGLASALVLGLGWLPAGVGSWVSGLIADQTSLAFAFTTLIFVPLLGVVAALAFAGVVHVVNKKS